MVRLATVWSSGAHPRSRGENQGYYQAVTVDEGSSPLTRGKRVARPQHPTRRGLIPAHAGKTCPGSGRERDQQAHPRSRGENSVPSPRAWSGSGSSPLTRGKRNGTPAWTSGIRLIPAHAGKTPTAANTLPDARAHPRSRGENRRPLRPWPVRWGSSPLTRGKHFPTCAFTAQIDQILETLELAVSSGSYSIWVACATDAPQDQVRSIGLVLPSSRGAS